MRVVIVVASCHILFLRHCLLTCMSFNTQTLSLKPARKVAMLTCFGFLYSVVVVRCALLLLLFDYRDFLTLTLWNYGKGSFSVRSAHLPPDSSAVASMANLILEIAIDLLWQGGSILEYTNWTWTKVLRSREHYIPSLERASKAFRIWKEKSASSRGNRQTIPNLRQNRILSPSAQIK